MSFLRRKRRSPEAVAADIRSRSTQMLGDAVEPDEDVVEQETRVLPAEQVIERETPVVREQTEVLQEQVPVVERETSVVAEAPEIERETRVADEAPEIERETHVVAEEPVEQAPVETVVRHDVDDDTQPALPPVVEEEPTQDYAPVAVEEPTQAYAPVVQEEPTQAYAPAVASYVDQESDVERTGVDYEPVRDREAERAERNQMLGVITRTQATTTTTDVPTLPVAPPRRTTDKWHGSLALFLLRLLTGGIVGLHGVQRLLHLAASNDYFSHSILPQPSMFALGTAIAEIVIGVLLVLGLATRFAGLLLAALSIAFLVIFIWGKVNPFADHVVGFNGELELMLTGAGLLFLLLGGGGWAIDRAVRRSRARSREARALGQI